MLFWSFLSKTIQKSLLLLRITSSLSKVMILVVMIAYQCCGSWKVETDPKLLGIRKITTQTCFSKSLYIVWKTKKKDREWISDSILKTNIKALSCTHNITCPQANEQVNKIEPHSEKRGVKYICKKYQTMSACTESAGWHGPKLFAILRFSMRQITILHQDSVRHLTKWMDFMIYN